MIILIGHGHSVLDAVSVVEWYGTILQAYVVRFNIFAWIIRPERLLNVRDEWRVGANAKRDRERGEHENVEREEDRRTVNDTGWIVACL